MLAISYYNFRVTVYCKISLSRMTEFFFMNVIKNILETLKIKHFLLYTAYLENETYLKL